MSNIHIPGIYGSKCIGKTNVYRDNYTKIKDGARSETRTHMEFPPEVFETSASANSAIRATMHKILYQKKMMHETKILNLQ